MQWPPVKEEEDEGEGDDHGLAEQAEDEEAERGEIPGPWGLGFEVCVARVGQECQEPEKGAENVLAFGDPGDGFDVERVPGEQGGDCGAQK